MFDPHKTAQDLVAQANALANQYGLDPVVKENPYGGGLIIFSNSEAGKSAYFSAVLKFEKDGKRMFKKWDVRVSDHSVGDRRILDHTHVLDDTGSELFLKALEAKIVEVTNG